MDDPVRCWDVLCCKLDVVYFYFTYKKNTHVLIIFFYFYSILFYGKSVESPAVTFSGVQFDPKPREVFIYNITTT